MFLYGKQICKEESSEDWQRRMKLAYITAYNLLHNEHKPLPEWASNYPSDKQIHKRQLPTVDVPCPYDNTTPYKQYINMNIEKDDPELDASLSQKLLHSISDRWDVNPRIRLVDLLLT